MCNKIEGSFNIQGEYKNERGFAFETGAADY